MRVSVNKVAQKLVFFMFFSDIWNRRVSSHAAFSAVLGLLLANYLHCNC